MRTVKLEGEWLRFKNERTHPRVTHCDVGFCEENGNDLESDVWDRLIQPPQSYAR